MSLQNKKKKSSGKLEGEANRNAFKLFVEMRWKKNDWVAFVPKDKKKLIRKKIAKKCGFSRTAFRSNPRLGKMLITVEVHLRNKGLLRPGKNISEIDAGSRDENIEVAMRNASGLLQEIGELRNWLEEIELEMFRIGREEDVGGAQ